MDSPGSSGQVKGVVGNCQGALRASAKAIPRRSAPDVGAAHGAAGAGRARPPRSGPAAARAARRAGQSAEQTSAPKTQPASARGADSAAPSAAKVSAQSAQPGDEAASPLKANRRPDCPDTSAVKPAVKPAGDTTSAPKTRHPGRQAATAGAARAAPPARTETSAAKEGGATGAAAATWTAPAGGAAAPNTCCRSITSCRMPRAAPPNRTISACCAPPITATATPAPDSTAPARIGRRRFRSAPPAAEGVDR